ncbi:MAG: ornithine cyclodeaminase family protein [Brevundimonas sp.]|uniref:ornithine cyclodeaminase family protein n=1 Tax=Brevundimonas sp. TaxID=1871086 RepID=UPI002717B402|nr:ornithine cyclodeaminase family protein [Brevundimonas sp.]MDO9607905.1 ornithine cyclodeaminase family protein [Brevundimonas sp.]
MLVLDREFVRTHLTYAACIPLMRDAMCALSRGDTRQPLRSIIPLAQGRAFGVMPGALSADGVFGAKLVSVYPENHAAGLQSHQGGVALFDPETGALSALVHAGEVTGIRTAAASAAATQALARADASRLAILGTGEQAAAHVRALHAAVPLSSVTIWGRSMERAVALAARLSDETGLTVAAVATVAEAAADADIICTTTASAQPILHAADVPSGCHINVVGSSYDGPVEIDDDLVVRARFIADSRAGVLAQGAEFLSAKRAGRVDDDHVVAEIGEVFLGLKPGRTSDREITVYKSLGHVAQDLASARYLLDLALSLNQGVHIPF